MVCVKFPVESGLDVDAMSVHVVPLREDCHLMIAPVWPLRLIVVPAPLQMVPAAALGVPPTLSGSTVIVTGVELALEHTPLWTTARNCVVWFRFPVVSGLDVDTMSDHVVPFKDDCHLTIDPVWPLRVIVVPFPLQTVPADAVAVPPTVTGLTVTTDALEFALEHTPLWTTALN